MQPRDLSAHVAYEAGGGLEEVARELGTDPGELVKLASNENPLGPSPAAVEAVREHVGSVHGYPKASVADLRAALAAEWGVAERQVWPSPGADGAIDLLSRAMLAPGDGALVPEPGFAYYPMSTRYHHGAVRSYPVVEGDDAFEISPERVLDAYDGERLVYLTSPHNPTGAELGLDGVREVAERTAAETLVAVDEAYGEFTAAPSAVDLLDARDDVAVLRTFSKAYGLAGLRLGYAVVPDDWADAYALVNTPFAVNELAARAGRAALDDDEHVAETVAVARESRERLRTELDAPTYESGGNFVLVDVGHVVDGEDVAARVAEAAKERGVIVRDCGSFGLPDHVRVTSGTDEETDRAVAALNDAIAELR
jgi:histidinol-phosphate aminotransferase